VRITFDRVKRDKTRAERGLDFEDAALVFAGVTVEVEDTRRDYGEPRIICYGTLQGRVVVVDYTPRGAVRHIFSMERQITVSKSASPRTLKSDLARADAHRISRSEYEELPELSDESLARATVNKGGRPRSANPRQLISLRLPSEVIARWRATGPGWQTRMAERLSRVRVSTHSKGES
jgi:uncharacterized DUF497 family protein/uncharacterized protein (DUF4415 family)